MRENVKKILEGNFHYENGSLDFSYKKIELTLPKGSVYEGSFHITSKTNQITHGYISTSDMRMECLNCDFTGNEVEIGYCFHGENMEEGDVMKGAFSIISNCGEYYLPFVVSIEHTVIESSMGPIKNLFHFANLARACWEEAVNVFYSPEFATILVGSDAHFYDSYRALSAHYKSEQNVEEFLIQIHKKQPVNFVLQEKQLQLELAVRDNSYAVTELELNIVRNGWGYTALQIAYEGDFLLLEKEVLTDNDFLGNNCHLPVYVDSNRCRNGKNFGVIYLYNSFVYFEVPVVVTVGEGSAMKHTEYVKKHSVMRLMELYQAFRLKKMSTNVWLKETGKIVEQLVALDEKDIGGRLFQAQLLLTEERYNEANWLLEHLAELMEKMGMEDSTLWAYYLYLTTLIHREEKYVNRVTAQVEQIYRRNQEQWRVAWLLLYLSEDYNRSASEKWRCLEKQFASGCSSPVLYLEALLLLNNNPTLLRKLGKFEIQILYYGVRKEALGGEILEQLLYLCGKVREYSTVLFRVLERLYHQNQDTRILQELCTLLIKGGKAGTKYFEWYQRGVEKQLRITNLYEYYMLSVDTNRELELPKIVLMYFSYQNNLGYEHCAFLYHYMWQHKEEYQELFQSYRPKIERFVMEQIQKEHINRHLAGLYQEMLSPSLVTEQTAEHLAKLLYAHQIRVEDTRLCKVLVYQEGNMLPAEYDLQTGCAWVILYGNENTIVFEDAWGNRFLKSVEYTLEKLMLPGKYLRMLEHYVENVFAFDVYLCVEERGESRITPEKRRRYERVIASEYAELPLKREICMKLLQLYYEEDDMRTLDEYLDHIPMDLLSSEERGQVLHYMVMRGKYESAYACIRHYDPYFADAKTLMRLASERIQQEEFMENPLLLAAALQAFRKGKYDSTILEYLSKYYVGMSKDMRDIWKTAKSFDLDCYELSERILVQMLYSGAFVGERMTIFRYYIAQGAKQEVEEAVLAQCAYEYFVKERLTELFIFQEIRYAYLRGELIQKICKLAYLKYYAENKEQLQEEDKPLVRQFLKEMTDAKIHMNFFREYVECKDLLIDLEDKTIIEYHANPGGRARIHYVILHENGEAGEYLSEYMQEICDGVFFKEFVLFFGETLQYYIMEENYEEEQLTESGNLQKNEVTNDGAVNKYNLINDLILSKTLQDYDTMDQLLEEYYRKEYYNEQLFPLL